MPIYEYRCANCQHQFEEMQKINEPVLTVCPECGKPDLQRLISHTSFQLKGEGWYVTDFRDKDKKPETKSNKEGDKPSEASATTAAANETAKSKEEPKESKVEPKDKPAGKEDSKN